MNTNTKQDGLYFYRIKTEWLNAQENGECVKIKTEELVMATSYSEAEKVAYTIAEQQGRFYFGDIDNEIIKTKISDVWANEVLSQGTTTTCGLIHNFFQKSDKNGIGLYSVKIAIFTTDEKTGKSKQTLETIFVPATSSSDAIKRIEQSSEMNGLDFVVRDTRFDKAEAIYWPADIHQSKMKKFDLN